MLPLVPYLRKQWADAIKCFNHTGITLPYLFVFLPVSHTNFLPDPAFGILESKFRVSEVATLDDLKSCISTPESRLNLCHLVTELDGSGDVNNPKVGVMKLPAVQTSPPTSPISSETSVILEDRAGDENSSNPQFLNG